MDSTLVERQQRFRDKRKSEGICQRVFFLSDAAMVQLKKHKEATKSPSMNHTLEILLKDAPKVFAQLQRFAAQHELVTAQGNPSVEEELQRSVELGRLINMARTL